MSLFLAIENRAYELTEGKSYDYKWGKRSLTTNMFEMTKHKNPTTI